MTLKVTDDLLEGVDLSLKAKEKRIFASSKASLEDILHVLLVYDGGFSNSMSCDRGVIRFSGSRNTHSPDGEYFFFTLVYDLADKHSMVTLVGDGLEAFQGLSLNLLKLDGMQEINGR